MSGETSLAPTSSRTRQRRRSGGWYFAVALVLPSAAVALCLVAARLGESRRDDVLFYFFEESDVGHPGIVNVITTMGFASVAVLAALLAFVTVAYTRLNFAWIATAMLFTVLAIDNVLRLHDQLPIGPNKVHVAYWLALVAVAAALWPALIHRRGRPMLLLGLLMLAGSEAIDLFTRSDDATYEYFEELSLFEESLACVGAWCCVAAAIGLASEVVLTSADGPRDRSQ